jgi:hypothetical protein
MRMSKRYAKDEEALEVYSDKSKIFQLVTRFLSDSFFCVDRCLPSFVQCSKILLASEIYWFSFASMFAIICLV